VGKRCAERENLSIRRKCKEGKKEECNSCNAELSLIRGEKNQSR